MNLIQVFKHLINVLNITPSLGIVACHELELARARAGLELVKILNEHTSTTKKITISRRFQTVHKW
jgi:hypothetical protein